MNGLTGIRSAPGRAAHLVDLVGTAALVLLLVLLTACGGDGGTGPQNSAPEETEAGWADFSAGSYGAARSHFLAAIGADDGYADAYNGLGWAHAFSGNLSEAATALNNALANGLDTPEADAGLAVVYRDLPDYPEAVTHAQAVLTADPDWVFSRLTSVDHRDIRLVMAQALYRQGGDYFAQAQTQLDVIDPDNGLDPTAAGTWVVGGVTYGTYAEALLMALEAMAAELGAP